MLEIPVIWYSDNPDTPSRGYWDQHIWERIFSHELWKPPGSYSFTHHTIDDLNGFEKNGAIFIVPARHHASPESVTTLARILPLFHWFILILTGDEESVFPPDPFTSIHLPKRIYAQTPGYSYAIHESSGPTLPSSLSSRIIWYGDFYPPFTHETLADLPYLDQLSRPIDVNFMGQVNNEFRRDCVSALEKWAADNPWANVHITTSQQFLGGLPREEYLSILSQSKITLCPPGTYTPDTFRFFEALEAGSIPIVQTCSPKTPLLENGRTRWAGYWTRMMDGMGWGNARGYPVVTGSDNGWSEDLGILLTSYLREHSITDIPTHSLVSPLIQYSYAQSKRAFTGEFHDSIHHLKGHRNYPSTSDIISVVVPTSLSPVSMTKDPLSHIRQVIASIRAHEGLRDAEIHITADYPPEEQSPFLPYFLLYVSALQHACKFEWHNVITHVSLEHLHQSGMMRAYLSCIATPLILYVEHDTPIEDDIPWSPMCDMILDDKAALIRLHHEASVLPPHVPLMLDSAPQTINGIKVMRTKQWSQRPHLASLSWYESLIKTNFGKDSRCFIEDSMYGIVLRAHEIDSHDAWTRFPMYLYTPDENGSGHGYRRSGHLDSRGEMKKGRQVWSYDGPIPDGAPHPDRDEDRKSV